MEGLSIGFSCYVLKYMDGNDMEDLLLVFSHRLLWPLFGEKTNDKLLLLLQVLTVNVHSHCYCSSFL